MEEEADCCSNDIIEERYRFDLLKSANELRKEGIMCDVVLKANGKKFTAHKSILVAASPYFRGLFTNQMKEESQEEIAYEEIDASVMEEVLTFLYTGKIALTSENAEDVVAIADYLLLPTLKDLGIMYLRSKISPWTCFSMYVFADKYGCAELQTQVYDFINKNFDSLCFTEEFKSLNANLLMTFLQNENIVVAKEEFLYEAVLEWIYHDFESRSQEFERLFSCLRLASMSKYYLAEYIEKEPLVKQSDACMKRLYDIFKASALPDHHTTLKDSLSFTGVFRRRKCLETDDVGIVVTGGTYHPNKAYQTDCYIPDKGTWQQLASMCHDRDEHMTVTCEGFLYCIGGYKHTCTVERYDPRINVWTEVAPLLLKCAASAAVTASGKIYVLGGRDSLRPFAEVQCYDPSNNKWTLKAPMLTRRKAHSAVVLDGYIYVIGGVNERSGLLKSIESYDPDLNHWRHEASMRSARTFACASAINKKIYIIGGYEDEGMTPLASCDVFDAKTGVWTAVPDMHVRRAAAGVATIGQQIYIIGGISEHGARADVECFDEETFTWEVVTSMKAARAYIQCNVIKISKNTAS